MSAHSDESFDPVTWFAGSGVDASQIDVTCGEYVYGPCDAYATVKMRELCAPFVEIGKAVPSDVFILSVGAREDRARTAIGGLPYWPKERPWPRSIEGRPVPFLAQFNFSNSRDLVGATPGDILLIFACPDPRDGWAIRWEKEMPSVTARLVSEQDIPIASAAPATFYGTSWRTENYPKWRLRGETSLDSTWIILDDGDRILDAPLVYQLCGMQIGSGSYASDAVTLDEGDEIICTLPGISLLINRPYALLNVPNPLSEQESEKWTMLLSSIEDGSSIGVLFVVRTRDGRYRCAIKSAPN